MADINPTIRYDSDFSKVTADIKKLVREATSANAVFAQLNKSAANAKMQAAQTFASQAGFAGFKAQVVDLTGATENFGKALVKNQLTMKQYFKEAASAYKKDSRARALAEREVRRAQSTVVGMGDIGGKRKGLLLTPQSLDMKNANVQLQIATKQYEIFNDLVNKGATSLVNWGKNTQWAGRQLTVGLTVPMGIFATQALKAFADVDAEITRFRKVYGSDLTGTVGDATNQMVAQIQGMGAEFAKQYGIASKETMALAADLAAAGLEGNKLANAVNQTTRMMVLGEVDRQEAMKATLSIQTAFNQSSKELAQSVDFLNAVENQTSASLQDLVEAIPKTGPVIQALGGDIKDLSVLMTAMREGGINAAEGANALKSGMASLISPTTKAIEVARQFGVDLQGVVTKNKGQLMPMLLDFQDQLRGLDDFGKAKIIEEIFGKYQFARISALFDNLNQRGSQTVGMVKLMKASADELAKKSYSELKAQENAPSTRLAAMQQQLQEQLIKVGSDLAETLLPIMQKGLDILSSIVDGFNNLPGPIKSFAKILGGITVAAGPVLMLAGIFGNLIGNAIKFGMSIVNMFKRMTGHPVQQLQILSDEELAAKLAADQLTGAYDRQKTSVAQLNAALDLYIANLREAAAIAPPGAVRPGGRGPRPPMPPIRRAEGGVIYAQNGVDSGGRINGYGGGDTVPALLEPGEFVINKQSSAKYAPLLRDINQGKQIPGYKTGKTDLANNSWSKSKELSYLTQASDASMTRNSFNFPTGHAFSGTKVSKGLDAANNKIAHFLETSSIIDKELKAMANGTAIRDQIKAASTKVYGMNSFKPADWAKFEPIDTSRMPEPYKSFYEGVNSVGRLKKITVAAGGVNASEKLLGLEKSHTQGAGVVAGIDLDLKSVPKNIMDMAEGKIPVDPKNANQVQLVKNKLAGLDSLAIKKQYIGTTILEPGAFNNLINTLGGGGRKTPQQVLDIIERTASPEFTKALEKRFPGQSAESLKQRLATMITQTGAPVDMQSTKLMSTFVDELVSNERMQNSGFDINKKGSFNYSAAKVSKAYLGELAGMSEAEFAKFRRQQFTQSTLAVLNSERLSLLGANAMEQFSGLYKMFEPVEKILLNPNLTTAQKEELINRATARISTKASGIQFVRESEVEKLKYVTADTPAQGDMHRLPNGKNVAIAGRPVFTALKNGNPISLVKLKDGRFIEFNPQTKTVPVGAQAIAEEALLASGIREVRGVPNPNYVASAAESGMMARQAVMRKAPISPKYLSLFRKYGIRWGSRGGLVQGFAGGGPVGLMQILTRAEQTALPKATEMLQKGFNRSILEGEQLSALRKKQTGLIHDTKMFRGGRYNWDALEVGQTITIPGSRSWSTREDVADTFRSMHTLGAEKRSATISNNTLRDAGINPETFGRSDAYGMFRVATNREEELLLNRVERINQQRRGRRALDKVKELEAQKKALMDSPYPSQESTLFGMTEPKAFEVVNRERDLKEFDRLIRGSKVDYEVAKEQMARRRNAMKGVNEDPVIFEMMTPKGTQTVPLSDITGRGRYIGGMGAMDEFEHLLTDGTMRVVRKYIDERGVKRIVGEFVNANKFAFGGPVGKWNMPFRPNDPAMAAIKDWTGGEMGQFRNTAIHPIVKGKRSGYSGKTVGYRRGLNPNFNKDKLYKLLNSLGIMPEGIVMRRASTLNPGVSSEFADAQQMKLIQAIRTGKFDEVFGMELNQKGLSSFTSLDPRTGAEGFMGINRFHMRTEPMAFNKDLRAGTGKIERGITAYAGPQGYEQVYFQHTTSGVERGRDISANKVYGGETHLDEVLTYKLNSIIDAVSTDLKTRKTIFHTKGVPGFANGGRLPGFGGGDSVPAMLEPGEFVINKESSAKYAPLLQNINKDTLPGFRKGFTGGSGGFANAMGNASGMVMNLAFLPMMLDQAKTSEGTMQKLLYSVVAIQAIVGAIQAMQMLGSLKSGISSKMVAGKVAASKGLRNLGVSNASSIAKAGGRGVFTAARAGGAGVMQSLGLAAGASLGPILAVGAGIAAIGVGLYMWNQHLEELRRKAGAAYKEATEMAKVYNIELKKTSDALKENAAQAQSLGMGNVLSGRGQVEKDYAEAITKDYGDLIAKIKEASTEQEKINDLTGTYASLISQGFSIDQAKEITAEIARQAGATSQLSQAMFGLAGNIRNVQDAMDVMVSSAMESVKQLSTTEERVSALNGAYDNLVRNAAENPVQFAISSKELISGAAEFDPNAARQMLQQQMANAGYGEGSIARKELDKTNLMTSEGRKRAALLMQGIAAQIDESKLTLPTLELQAEVNKLTVAEQAKQDLNKQMDEVIKKEQENIDKANKWADAAIAGIEEQKKVQSDAHDKKMKQLEDEAEAIQDQQDLIRDNSDYYIKQLQKEYDAEQYYQKQRETATSGLQALAQGDIFGYLQSQMKASSDAAQFGREEAIKQIEETRDSSLKALDDALKMNDKARQGADDAFNKTMDGLDDKITAINTKRSQMIKMFQDIIDKAQAVKDAKVGEVTAEQMQNIENAGAEVAKIVPKQMQAGVTSATDMIVENFGTAIGEAVNTIAQDSNLSKEQASSLLSSVMGIFLGSATKKPTPKKKMPTGPEGAGMVTLGTIQTQSPTQQQANADLLNAGQTAVEEGNTTNSRAGTDVGGDTSMQYYYSKKGKNNMYSVWRWNGKKKKWQPIATAGKRGEASPGTVYGEQMAKDMAHSPYTPPGYNMGGIIKKYAGGVTGARMVPGFGSSDSVLAMLTPGESILDATATRRNPTVISAMNAGATFTVPQLQSYNGRMGSENESEGKELYMTTNINFNGHNLSLEQVKSSIYGEISKAQDRGMKRLGS